MYNNENKVLYNTPNWNLEIAACIINANTSREDEIIQNSMKYGMTKEEMTSYLSSITAYKQAVKDEIWPIFEQYPDLAPYFEETEFEKESDSLLLNLVTFLGDKITENLTDDAIDQIVNEYYSMMLSDFVTKDSGDEMEIRNLTDLVTCFRKLSIDDIYKMRMIDLYSDRHNILGQLKCMLSKCAGICQKHFPIIQKDFLRATHEMDKEDFLNQVLDAVTVVKIKDVPRCEITPMIFCFNQLSMRSSDGELYQFHIGIYLIELKQLKAKNRFCDTQLVTDLKAIGDPTRIKIIHLLLMRKMYLQELAVQLKLTPATVSHHINILLHSELICIVVDIDISKKVLYEVNGSKFEDLGEAIKNMIH